ncbi:MAG: hypothetical protein Q8K63_15875 [Acidimicrobiales bacterium]|nr:hypothetical protein [Acidimicrobiales bacterium]
MMTNVPLFTQGRFCDYCLRDDHDSCADEACVCGVGVHRCRPKKLTPIAAVARPDKPSALPRRRPLTP